MHRILCALILTHNCECQEIDKSLNIDIPLTDPGESEEKRSRSLEDKKAPLRDHSSGITTYLYIDV